MNFMKTVSFASMLKIITSSILLLLSFTSLGQTGPKELIPVIDYMRTTPAWIGGNVSFNGDYEIYSTATTKLRLLKNKSIRFHIKENEIIVYPEGAFRLRYLGLAIQVKEVRWNLKTGFKSVATLPIDITGLSRNYVSSEVASDLEKALGEQMKLANAQLYRVRRMKEFGTTIDIVKQIIRIFSDGSGSPLPTYHGEAALLFYPNENKVFGLYGMRVGVKKSDTFRMGFRFNGNSNGVYPYELSVGSSKGIDVNHGKTFKQNARISFNYLEMDKDGARIEMHLGASETIGAILTVAEEIAFRTGKPVQRCHQCYELIHLPPMRLMVEGQFRTALLQQVNDYTSVLLGLNISASHLNSFKKKERCRVNAAEETRQCRLKINGNDKIQACINKAEQRMNACLK